MEAEKAQTETGPSPGARSGMSTAEQQKSPTGEDDGRDDDGHEYDSDDDDGGGIGDGVVGGQQPKRPSGLARFFAKLGLDAPTLLMMFK